MAVESWDPMTNTIIYDDEIYNEKNSEWVRGYKFPKQQIPSDQEAFLIYLDSIELIQDKETQFIKLSMSHQSPFIAKKWLDIVNHNINEVIREKDKKNAEKAIIFLNDSAKSTNIQSLKEVTSTLLETQMQTLMLAASNQAYVLEIIDPPIVPELRSSPKRALICIFGTILGMFIAIMFCLLSKFTFKGKFLK
jgi:capsule polysaccharide export protein KpsE/RkpR